MYTSCIGGMILIYFLVFIQIGVFLVVSLRTYVIESNLTTRQISISQTDVHGNSREGESEQYTPGRVGRA